MKIHLFLAYSATAAALALLSGCSEDPPTPGASMPSASSPSTSSSGTPLPGNAPRPPALADGIAFGTVHSGSYNIGPVDFKETVWTNSCAPYPAAVQSLEGAYLAGVDNSLNGDGTLCDACALVTTRLGKKVLVRIITTGVSKAAGDMDLSPEAYAAIYAEDPEGTSEIPRPMTWQLAKCSVESNLQLQYQTEANPYWTSLWVRNGRLPISKLEVMGANRPQFTALMRGPDGTFTDLKGFGEAAFDLRVTASDGQTIVERFASFPPGGLVEMSAQFK